MGSSSAPLRASVNPAGGERSMSARNRGSSSMPFLNLLVVLMSACSSAFSLEMNASWFVGRGGGVQCGRSVVGRQVHVRYCTGRREMHL